MGVSVGAGGGSSVDLSLVEAGGVLSSSSDAYSAGWTADKQ